MIPCWSTSISCLTGIKSSSCSRIFIMCLLTNLCFEKFISPHLTRVLTGLTMAACPVAVWTETQSDPPFGNTKDFTSAPSRAITFDCGHKVSLQTFLKDQGRPREKALTGFTAYPELSAMTTASASFVVQ